MNKTSFYTALENLNEVGNIESIVAAFPYFQTARLLYLKKLQNNEDIHFEKELKKTAVYAGNRKVLYYLILHKAFTEKMVEIDTAITAEMKKTSPLPSLQKENEDGSPTIPKKEELLTTISQKEDSSSNLKKNDTPIPPAKRKKEPSPLDRQIIEQAISYSIEKEVKEITEAEKTEISAKTPSLNTKKTENIDISNLSFTEWLKYSSNKDKKNSQKKSIENLIEKFVETEPKIKSAKSEFFTPASIAKKSVQDNEDFVTETLAKIYVAQGNYNKAIKAFKRLSLNYPEKRTYFADQIKSIKDLIKEK